MYAKSHDGDFIVRIEDTDIKRNVVGGEQSQLDNLRWLGLDWDESPDKGGPFGPYRQLERLDLYKTYAQKLLDMDMAYKEYKENSSKYAIRFKECLLKEYVFNDLVRGTLKISNLKKSKTGSWLKTTGYQPNFAVVIDDPFDGHYTRFKRGRTHHKYP